MYRTHNIKYRYCNYKYAGAQKVTSYHKYFWSSCLLDMHEGGGNLVYLDESSFNSWIRKKHSWQPRHEALTVPLTKKRYGGVTIFGAVSKVESLNHFMLAPKTNTDCFIKFLKQLRARFKSDEEICIVMDNATAHRSKRATDFMTKNKITPLFLPPYTPELNSIEHLWAVYKSRVARDLGQ